MGFGDSEHQHILQFNRSIDDKFTCAKCELPMANWGYSCERCNYFVHRFCFQLPQTLRHPLHQQHSLILYTPNSPQITLVYCNECQNPCFGNYTYKCLTCDKFSLHLKCLVTVNIRTKHQHPLSLNDCGNIHTDDKPCQTCGLPIDHGYVFGCQNCSFYIHFECPFVPSKIKHHHVHELTLNHNFPEECDQVYCDRCEDKDGKELNRSSSYYYCKRCDYIAHVRCVTPQAKKEPVEIEHFHDHPLMFSKLSWDAVRDCAACKRWVHGDMYRCSECKFRLHKSCAEFPPFIRHPHHKDHILAVQSYVPIPLHLHNELTFCGFCHGPLDEVRVLRCTECNYVEHMRCALKFCHPLCEDALYFSSGKGTEFRCNACGELGDGHSMSHNFIYGEGQYDLHLECFALPGDIDSGFYSHPLFLISSSTNFVLSTSLLCKICGNEIDPKLWVYYCKECNFFAHLKCVSHDLLPALGETNNGSDLCTIITQIDKEMFRIDTKSTCLLLATEPWSLSKYRPLFRNKADEKKGPARPDFTEPNVQSIDVLHCPKCELPISTQIYSCISDWVHHNEGNKISGVNQISAHSEPLSQLSEELVDQLYCPICNQLIFSPTYSCIKCQIYFHKSCAELPRKCTVDPGHTFTLVAPSLRTGSLPACVFCQRAIESYAYICNVCKVNLHVQCALGAPFLTTQNHDHDLFSWPLYILALNFLPNCRACGKFMNENSMCFKCAVPDCSIYTHIECALLPFMVSHRIHKHPLVLEPELDTSVDDYVCDACEKGLNSSLWAYRCSGSCGDRATSHVSCIVTSNNKRHFRYDVECRGQNIADDNADYVI